MSLQSSRQCCNKTHQLQDGSRKIQIEIRNKYRIYRTVKTTWSGSHFGCLYKNKFYSQYTSTGIQHYYNFLQGLRVWRTLRHAQNASRSSLHSPLNLLWLQLLMATWSSPRLAIFHNSNFIYTSEADSFPEVATLRWQIDKIIKKDMSPFLKSMCALSLLLWTSLTSSVIF